MLKVYEICEVNRNLAMFTTQEKMLYYLFPKKQNTLVKRLGLKLQCCFNTCEYLPATCACFCVQLFNNVNFMYLFIQQKTKLNEEFIGYEICY